MKNRLLLKKFSWLLLLAIASMPLLSACKTADEHPKSEHPTQEHPTGTNAPAAKP